MAERKNRLWAIAAGLVVGGLVLGLLVSRPLPQYFTTGVPYTLAAKPDERIAGMVQGDHLQYMYHLGQFRLAVEGRAPWFRNTYEFAGNYGFTECYVYFPTALLYWPLSYVSEAFAFNAIILLSFVGTMIAGYGLARAWGADRGGAVCAGVVLTLFPARLAALYGGHPAGSAFFLFPMAWWGLEKNWQTSRAAWGWLAAACLALLARLDPHYLFYFCALLPFWAFWKLAETGTFTAPTPHAPASKKRALLDALPALVAALLFAGCVHYNQIRLHAIDGFGPQIIALAVFFLLAVAALYWLIARVVEWLGVADETFRRLWLTLPWFAFWLLAFYFAADVVETPKYGIRLVRACVALFLIAHVVFLIMAVQRKRLKPGEITLPWRRIVRLWPVALGLAIAVAYEMYLKLAVFDVSGVSGGRTLHEVRLFSVPPAELFSKATGNGSFIGWALPFCVVVGAIVFLYNKRALEGDRCARRRFWIAAALFVLGIVLTCGPLLSAYVPLYETLYHLVPFFNFTRATAKYAILTSSFGAVALGLTLTFRTKTPQRGVVFRSTIAAVIALLCVLDYLFIAEVGVSVLPKENKAYTHIAEHSKGAPLLEIPIWPGDSAHSGIYQYWTLRTQVPTVNGYSPTVPGGYIEHVFWPLYDVNYGRFGPREAELCRTLGVRYVNFHEEAFPRKVAEFPAACSLKMLRLNPRLKLVAEDGPVHCFEILDEPAPQREPPPSPLLTRYVPLNSLEKDLGKEIQDEAAIDGRAWAADGRRGRLFYGPFAVLPNGDYVAVFRIKAHAANPDDEIGTLDIYVKRDKTPPPAEPLVVVQITGADCMDAEGYRFVEVPFTLDGTQVVETRGWFEGVPGTSFALDYVFIQSTATSETIRIEAEEMFYTPTNLVENRAASQGFLLTFKESAPETNHRLDERFLLLDAGTYRLGWHGSGGVAAVRRVTADGSEPVASAFIPRNENGALGTALSRFDVPRRGVYAVDVKGRLDRVDYIELAPAGPDDGTTSTTPTSTARSRVGNSVRGTSRLR